MVEKEGGQQLELFSHSGANGHLAAGAQGTSAFFARLWNYEKFILVAIALLVTAVVSFSLGMERGRRVGISVREPVAPGGEVAERPARRSPIMAPVVAKTDVPVAAPAQAAVEQPVKAAGYGYTIQLASFQTKKLAEREAESLRKKGHEPLVLNKSGYTVVCVGKFSDKESARTLLSEFRKKYKDCFIRRL